MSPQFPSTTHSLLYEHLGVLCLHSLSFSEEVRDLEVTVTDLETLRIIIVMEEGLTRTVDFLDQENISIMLNVHKGDLNTAIV